MTFLEAAYEILKKQGHPMRVGEITGLAIGSRLIEAHGKTPASTMAGCLYRAVSQEYPKGISSNFVRVKGGYWGLKEWKQ
ncbi:hypothetical protein ES703_90971 [subsurface metagenome]